MNEAAHSSIGQYKATRALLTTILLASVDKTKKKEKTTNDFALVFVKAMCKEKRQPKNKERIAVRVGTHRKSTARATSGFQLVFLFSFLFSQKCILEVL